MTAYYNEIDPYAAEWLRNLITAGLIAPGDVDTRSIEDVRPADLVGYTQCHFFAGIGGWSLALRLAGWPDDQPVWTGSCPCQPFSAAGKGAGVTDERHLWPAWQWLIGQCRPVVLFGEQVEAAIKHDWLDLVQTDLEGLGYTAGAVCLPAAGVGAPHARSRLWFVADHHPAGRSLERRAALLDGERTSQWDDVDGRGTDGELADSDHAGGRALTGTVCKGTAARVRNPEGQDDGDVDDRGEPGRLDADTARPVTPCGGVGGMADAECGVGDGRTDFAQRGPEGRDADWLAGQAASFWSACDWLPCRDGKYRPVEPGAFPLAHGVPARVGRLRAYGNAIVPQVAAEVIRAYLDARP